MKNGQLRAYKGETYYTYNDCGDLIEKRERKGPKWRYSYHPSGLMDRVIRPDGKEVSFAYDPIGRRVSKEYVGKTTNYLWDGDKIVHEWVAEEGTSSNSSTNVCAWLFEEDTFAPLVKLTHEQAYSITSDHLGTPQSHV